MKRYLLGYLTAYLASVLAFAVMLLIAISQWLFTDSPLWFDVLCVVVCALPILLLGEVWGRHPGKQAIKRSWPGLLLLLGLWLGLGAAGLALMEAGGVGQVFVWPGMLFGSALEKLADPDGFWEAAFPLLGHLLMPLLYQLGWHWGHSIQK